nr:beta-ketoacyl synthase N-terminal-like domain-containing protein [Dictyobacter vulcani]
MGEVTNRAYRETGLQSLTNAEGLRLLDQLLGERQHAVVLPAVVDLAQWQPETWLRAPSAPARAPRRVAPGGETPVAAPRAEDLVAATHTWLRTLFSAELRIEPAHLELDEPVQEYGVDSIILAQIVQRINQQLMVTLDPSILYEYPSIAGFASWLLATHADALAALLAPAASPSPVATPGVSTGNDAVDPPVAVERPVPPPPPSVVGQVARPVDRPAMPVTEDIAVVGLSCRFPGAETLERYWELLASGRSAIGSVPPERWGVSTPYYAGLLETLTTFDPAFFLLADEDVQAMDPQALLVLEECLKLWYHAGYRHEEIKGQAIGIYLGGRSQHQPGDARLREARNPIVAVGQNYLAANLSRFFDVRGPSVVVDTACSSALVGLNMAIQALRSGEIEAAVVGGVSVLPTEATHRLFQQRGLLCKTAAFHLFDERADGIVLGEGVGMVLVKTVRQAQQDGDRIYAVIKATAVNNDGRTAGPATPNLQAQKEVMQTALARSGKRAEEISYVEANGSGSMVTDLIELKAIQAVYGGCGMRPLGLGSIKPNIGHPLCAEGIASLIKVVLMLQQRQQVPFLSGGRRCGISIGRQRR